MADDGKLWAVLSYIFILWIFPLWVIKPRNAFAVYHAKQGLGLFIVGIVVSLVAWIPIIGQLIWLVYVVFWILGLVNAIRGLQKPVPLLGTHFEQWFATV